MLTNHTVYICILIGPPESGKTMLAKRISTILPPFKLKEVLETTKIHSVAGKIGKDNSLMTQRPFRSPHHTISNVAPTLVPDCIVFFSKLNRNKYHTIQYSAEEGL